MIFKRLPWRFSLRIAAISITLLCIWLGLRVRQATQQARFAKLVQELGGELAYRHQVERDQNGTFVRNSSLEPKAPKWLRNLVGDEYFQVIDQVHLTKTNVTDDWLQHLTMVPNLRVLSLRETDVTGESLHFVRGLHSLEILDLWRCQQAVLNSESVSSIGTLRNLKHLDLTDCDVTDEALAELADLTALQTLSLHGNGRVTDKGVSQLRGMTEMTHLWLGGTGVTDNGIRHLSPMNKLVWLDLSDSQVTDHSLEYLLGKSNLQQLECVRTQVTESGIKQLRAKLSKLELTSAGSGAVW